MKPVDYIGKSFKKLHVSTSCQLDEQIFGEISRATVEAENRKSANQPNIWRIIMKNRITRLAVAAGVIIAMLIGINLSRIVKKSWVRRANLLSLPAVQESRWGG